ncbi:MAG: dihydrodipicolinate reductase C-terminal domain-containing protein [Patescibacteria group bacterium]|nr:dihydrodipicolinate reductase C-terminal domain-containing protein [Patescibacteria group bacterium]
MMKPATIVIAGHGKMARALTALCQSQTGPTRLFFDFTEDMACLDYDGMVAVHFGSGKQLPALLDWCQRHNVPLIQGSTKLTLPAEVTVPVVDAPNLSLPIIKLFGILPVLQHAFGDMSVRVIESHQADKPGVSGTAIVMAKAFGVTESEIDPIRQPAIQTLLGVPSEHLKAHGYHWIEFNGAGVSITVSTKVNGRQAYAEGALVIADALIQHRHQLEARVYRVTDILGLMSL